MFKHLTMCCFLITGEGTPNEFRNSSEKIVSLKEFLLKNLLPCINKIPFRLIWFSFSWLFILFFWQMQKENTGGGQWSSPISSSWNQISANNKILKTDGNIASSTMFPEKRRSNLLVKFKWASAIIMMMLQYCLKGFWKVSEFCWLKKPWKDLTMISILLSFSVTFDII